MKKKIIAIILSIATLLSIIPFANAIANTGESDTNGIINYGAVIGNTAQFNIEKTINFLVFENPETFDYELDWDNDENWLYFGSFDGSNDFEEDQLFVIENYYYDDETTALWYKLGAAPGHELPERMKNATWAFQNFTFEYENEYWEEYAPNALIINDAQNYVFDSDGNLITSAEIELYDTLTMTCKSSLAGSVTYQWQILVGDEWVDVLGSKKATVEVDFSLLYSALDKDNKAQLRCVTKSGSKSVVGDAITVTYATTAPTPLKMSTPTYYAADDSTPPNNQNVCYVTIQYLFESGIQAANSYVAQVPLNVESLVDTEFPPVQGYLPYFNDVRQDDFYLPKVFTENEIYTVVYKPTLVDYTVDIYFQNVTNDDYTFYKSYTYQGLTASNVPVKTQKFDGMHELLHETPPIAADGTTHIEVYYDRLYFMTRVYLSGGYGIYSVYARYGADLQSHLTAPERPGYTFVGWDEYVEDTDGDEVPDSGGNGIADTVYPTVPNRNLAYVALWVENPTAQVNIVFWGQDPNDDEVYSYLETQPMYVKPGTELTYSLTLDGENYPCGLQEHTHGNGCKTKCGMEEHKHTIANGCYNLICTKTSHNHISDNCTLNCQHEHVINSANCYRSAVNNRRLQVTNKPNNLSNDLEDGVHSYRSGNTTYYYLKLGNNWYCNYSTSSGNKRDTVEILDCSHSHGDSCYTCGEVTGTHTHTLDAGCYTLTCTKKEHPHIGTCYTCVEHTHSEAVCGFPKPEFKDKDYDISLWELAPADQQQTVTVERDGSTVLNVYLNRKLRTLTFYYDYRNYDYRKSEIITAKWGASIVAPYKQIVENAGSSFWSASTSGSSPYTNFFGIMPQQSASYYNRGTTGSNGAMTYYGQNLDGSGYTEMFTVTGVGGYTVSKEDRYEFEGYEYSHGADNGDKCAGAKFYYDREENLIEFHSGNKTVRTESVLYQLPLSVYSDYTNPPLPDNVEEGSHKFVGWYLNPECTRPADLATMTMPAGNLALYAKWEPEYHEVRLVREKKEDGNYTVEDSLLIVEDAVVGKIDVLHGTIVFAGNENKTPPLPTNPPYHFLGWFYEDEGVELMWDFEHHPIVRDTVIYAKWSSNILVPYTIYYKDVNGNEIAAPTTASSLAGHSVTVEAKVGKELYEGYQEGYFPRVSSHSIPLDVGDADSGVEFTFVYEAAPTKEYTIHYINKATGQEMTGSPVHKTSTYAVVTETFKYYDGYVPNEYQQSLVLSADTEKNHIYFYYEKSNTDGVWFVGHYIQDIDSDNADDPDQYTTLSAKGDIGKIDDVIVAERPSEDQLSPDGFTFYKATISKGDETITVDSIDDAKGEITAKGLEIKVYYKRNKYPYKVMYRDKDTGDLLLEVKYNASDQSNWEHYGKTITEPLPRPDFDGYEFYSASVDTIMADDPDNITWNIIYVYLTEQTFKITFHIVGPDGCGALDTTTASVKASDPGATCTATPAPGYRFVGWYPTEACQSLIITNPMLVLARPDSGWQPEDYYAKFELGVADLTIKRENAAEDSQVYVYKVKNTETGEVIYVTVTGNGQVTIKDLLLGNYTVTQQNSWSWRNNDSAQSVEHSNADGTTVTFNGNSSDKWLNGNSTVKTNKWGQLS